MPYCVGITGDIASGKTTVGALFSKLGIDVFSADKISRELTQNDQPAYQQIRDHFGPEILQADKTINRSVLRHIIVTQEKERHWLEALLHPLIREELKKQVAASTTPYCMVEIPLLTTKQVYPYLNRIVLVTVPLAIQMARIMERDQCTKAHAEAILATQPPHLQRLEHADDVIINDKTQKELEEQVNQLHDRYVQEARAFSQAKPKPRLEVASFFNEHWASYKAFVLENRLYHQEMLAVLDRFLHQHIKHPFSFVDVGCGDCSLIQPILMTHPIKKYIGIDLAETVLKTASLHLAPLQCEKQFIYDDMISAMTHLKSPVDVIFCSQSLHHLPSYQDKLTFIEQCKNKLTPKGFLIVAEGILEEHQTREQLLLEIEEAYQTIYPEITENELNRLMKHHRNNVFPTDRATYVKMAHTLKWKEFRILFRKGNMVFMVFSA